jgi:hypothetical protein
MVGQSLTPLNKIADGSVSAGSLNEGALANQASKLKALANKMENAKGMEKYKKNKSKAELELKKQMQAASGGYNPNSLGSTNSGLPSSPKEAALMLEKELEKSLPTVGGGGDTIATPSNQAPSEDLEFGMNQDQLADQDKLVAEVMKENLDYGGNDINQSSNTNIFQVLSNRYQRSGMRRLFDEKGTTKPDAPALSEINK